MSKTVLGIAGVLAAPFTGGASLALTGAALATAAGERIIGGKKSPAAAPAQAGAPVMPIADDEAVMRARKNSMLKQRGRGGRSSTILSQGAGGGSGAQSLGGGYG